MFKFELGDEVFIRNTGKMFIDISNCYGYYIKHDRINGWHIIFIEDFVDTFVAVPTEMILKTNDSNEYIRYILEGISYVERK